MTYSNIRTERVMPVDKYVALCRSLGLDPAATVSITLRCNQEVEALVIDAAAA